jgi:hypothetical protein
MSHAKTSQARRVSGTDLLSEGSGATGVETAEGPPSRGTPASYQSLSGDATFRDRQ